jgi:GT2 family glycosyltransferase
MITRTTSIVIVTFNRREDLRRTLGQLRSLDPQPEEIIIFLDGCTDGSHQMLLADFPECRVMESKVRRGSVPSRDEAFRTVTSDLILSLDDDSYPVESDFLQRLSKAVDRVPEAGVLTFPEIYDDGSSPDPAMSPAAPGRYVPSFSNCASATVRALYGRTAEYPPFFSHMYEEPDYGVQLYAAGHSVWFEPSLPVRHHFSPVQRNMLSRHRLHARNELWSAIMRCPLLLLPIVVPYRVLRQLTYSASMGWQWVRVEPEWWMSALRGLPQCLRGRHPVSARAYWMWMRLGHR